MRSNNKSSRGAGGSGGGGNGGGEPPGGGRGGKPSSGGGPAAGGRRDRPKKGEEGYESDESGPKSTPDLSLVEQIEPRESQEYDNLNPDRSLGRRVIDSLHTIPPRFGRNLLIGVLVVLFIGIHMRLIFGSEEENARGNESRRLHNLNFLRIFTGTLNGGSGTFSSSDVESLYDWLVTAGIIPRRLGTFNCNHKPYLKNLINGANERVRERIETHVRDVELMDLIFSIFHGGIARVVENAMHMGDILNSAMVEANEALNPARLFHGFASELGELRPTGNATVHIDYDALDWNQRNQFPTVPPVAEQPAAAHGMRRRAVANNSSESSEDVDSNPVGPNATRNHGRGRGYGSVRGSGGRGTNHPKRVADPGAGGNVGGGTTSVLGKRNASNLQGSTEVSPPLRRRRSAREHPSSRVVDMMLNWSSVNLTGADHVSANDITNACTARDTSVGNVNATAANAQTTGARSANNTTNAQTASAGNVNATVNSTTNAQTAGDGIANNTGTANHTTNAQTAGAGNANNTANHANNVSNVVAAGGVVRNHIIKDMQEIKRKRLELLHIENEKPTDPELRFGKDYMITYADLMVLTPSQRLNNESLAGRRVTTMIRERNQAGSVMPEDGVTGQRWRTLTFGTIYRIDGRNGLLMNPQMRNFYEGMRGTSSCRPSCAMNRDKTFEKHDWKTNCTKCGIEGGCVICNIDSEARTDIFAAVCDWCFDAMMKIMPSMDNYFMCPHDGCFELLGLDFRIFYVKGKITYRCMTCSNKILSETIPETQLAPTTYFPYRRVRLNGTKGEIRLTEYYNRIHTGDAGVPNIADPVIDFRHPSRTYRSADEILAARMARNQNGNSANDVDDEISNISNISNAAGAASSVVAPSPDAAAAASNHELNASSADVGNASIVAADNASNASNADVITATEASSKSSTTASNASKASAAVATGANSEVSTTVPNASKASAAAATGANSEVSTTVPNASQVTTAAAAGASSESSTTASNASKAPAAAAAEASSDSSAAASNAFNADAAAATEASDSNQPQTPIRPVGAAAARSAGSPMIISPNGDGGQGNDQMNISPSAPVDGDDGQEHDTMIVTLRPSPRIADTRQEDGQRNAAPVDGDGGQANDQIVVRLNVDPPRLEADAGREDDQINADAASLETETQIVDLHTQDQAAQLDDADIHNQQGMPEYDQALDFNCSEVGIAKKELADCEKSAERRKQALEMGLSVLRNVIAAANENILSTTKAIDEAELEIARLRKSSTDARRKLATTAKPSAQAAALGSIDFSAIQDSQQIEALSRQTAYDMVMSEIRLLEGKISALERSNRDRNNDIRYEQGRIEQSELRKRDTERSLSEIDCSVQEAKLAYDHAVCVERAETVARLSNERNARKQAEAVAAAKAAKERAIAIFQRFLAASVARKAAEKAAAEAAAKAAAEAAAAEKAAAEAAAKAAAEAAAAEKAAAEAAAAAKAAAEAAEAERLRRNAEINRPLITELERNTDAILIDLHTMDNMMRSNFGELLNEEARRIFNTEPAVTHTMDTEDVVGRYRSYFETDDAFMNFVRRMYESASRIMNSFETVRARLNSDAGTMGHGEGDSDSMPPSSDGGLSRVSSAGGLSRASSVGGLSRGRSASRGRRVSRGAGRGVSNERISASDEGGNIDGADVSEPTDDSVRERDLTAMRRRLGFEPESANVANTLGDFIESISVGGGTSFAQHDLDPNAPDFDQRSSDRFREQFLADLLHARRTVGAVDDGQTDLAENQDDANTASTRGWGALEFRTVPVRGELINPAPAPAPVLHPAISIRPRTNSRRGRRAGRNSDCDTESYGSSGSGGAGSSGGSSGAGGSRT